AGRAAGNGGVEKGEALLLGLGGKLAGNVRRSRRVVDEHRALAHAGKGAVGPERHLPEVVVIADAGKDDVLAGRRLARRRRGFAASVGDPFLRLGRGAIIYRHLVTFGLEVTGHRKAHDAQTEKCCLDHDRLAEPEALIAAGRGKRKVKPARLSLAWSCRAARAPGSRARIAASATCAAHAALRR